jgi:hypothetical protein
LGLRPHHDGGAAGSDCLGLRRRTIATDQLGLVLLQFFTPALYRFSSRQTDNSLLHLHILITASEFLLSARSDRLMATREC